MENPVPWWWCSNLRQESRLEQIENHNVSKKSVKMIACEIGDLIIFFLDKWGKSQEYDLSRPTQLVHSRATAAPRAPCHTTCHQHSWWGERRAGGRAVLGKAFQEKLVLRKKIPWKHGLVYFNRDRSEHRTFTDGHVPESSGYCLYRANASDMNVRGGHGAEVFSCPLGILIIRSPSGVRWLLWHSGSRTDAEVSCGDPHRVLGFPCHLIKQLLSCDMECNPHRVNLR